MVGRTLESAGMENVPSTSSHNTFFYRSQEEHRDNKDKGIVVTNHMSARLHVYTLYNYSLKGHFLQHSPSVLAYMYMYMQLCTYPNYLNFTHIVFEALFTDLFDISMISIDILPRLGNTTVKQERWKSHISPHMCSYTCMHCM